VLSPFLLLLGAEALEAPEPLSITIDPCVEVDAAEVRRLAAIELGTWRGERSLGPVDVVVSCSGGLQELRLTERAHGRVTVRSIDLRTPLDEERDAKARELALAIAELLRRVESEPAAPVPAPLRPVPERRTAAQARPQVRAERRPVRFDVGVSGVGSGWTGGEVLLGADVDSRVRFGRWFIAELRAGGRKSRSVELSVGTVAAHGAALGVGLALALLDAPLAGVSLGTRVEGGWLRYVVLDRAGRDYGSGDALSLSLLGAAAAFARLAGPLRFTADVALGGALRSITVRDHAELVSGMSGLVVSSAAGMAVEF
jgi:hypothetical protein